MEIIILFIIAIVIYYFFKKNKTMSVKEKIADINNICFSVLRDINNVKSNNIRIDEDIREQMKLISRIHAAMIALQKVYSIYPEKNSPAIFFFDAVGDMNYEYTTNMYNHLYKKMNGLIEKNRSTDIFINYFLKGKAENDFVYSRKIKTFSYDDYYKEYINILKNIDKNYKDEDRVHWVELADDEYAKDAYKDGLRPDQLARHVLDNASILNMK
jgi:hypothetical protein